MAESDRCASCPAAAGRPCLCRDHPDAPTRAALCRRAGSDPAFRALVARRSDAGPAPAPRPIPEAESLAVLPLCRSALLCGCATGGIECAAGGRYAGARGLTPAHCRTCLTTA